jgi:uncharacterized membrane protein YqiK
MDPLILAGVVVAGLAVLFAIFKLMWRVAEPNEALVISGLREHSSPEGVGEVMIPIRGGSEAFNAYAADTKDTISTGTRVVVIEYFPPRTVVVSPM